MYFLILIFPIVQKMLLKAESHSILTIEYVYIYYLF